MPAPYIGKMDLADRTDMYARLLDHLQDVGHFHP